MNARTNHAEPHRQGDKRPTDTLSALLTLHTGRKRKAIVRNGKKQRVNKVPARTKLRKHKDHPRSAEKRGARKPPVHLIRARRSKEGSEKHESSSTNAREHSVVRE